ncbi:hypothetical protein BGX27_006519 [Mortierella sp. AM989]|nr:hypothetical protein BGX27_006519 [Mortierella sp. AM989]
MKPLSAATKKETFDLFKKGKSIRHVAAWLNISQRSAANILPINNENLVITKGGRPHKLTTKDTQIARLDLNRG